MKNKFYITTPIYYANAGPHLGHTYATIAGDVLARAHRLAGEATFFLVGTDEHGAKIQEIAQKAGKDPKVFVDQVAREFQDAWKLFGIENDCFIRTTDPAHIKAVEKALQTLYDSGDIYKGFYEGLYCVGCEQFKTENDLIDGLCPLHKQAPETMKEESYMFRLSKYQDVLLEKIKNDELVIIPETRKNEVVSFYENEGLKDVSFSRKNVSWGIPIPWETSHTAYVWADAFLSYLTGIGWDGTPGTAPEFWPADVHLLAKDILRVHATIWPAMLLALNLPLPRTILIHGFFLVDGQKMSKSLGNVITPQQLSDRFGSDATRYLLMSATPFGNDSDVNWKRLDEHYNSDLANGLGNLIQRVATLIESNLDGELIYKSEKLSSTRGVDILEFGKSFEQALENFELHKAIELIWSIIAKANQYVDERKPWVETKENPDGFLETMTTLVLMIHYIAWFLQPFMPEIAEKIVKIFGDDLSNKEIPENYKFIVKKGGGLFPRIQ